MSSSSRGSGRGDEDDSPLLTTVALAAGYGSYTAFGFVDEYEGSTLPGRDDEADEADPEGGGGGAALLRGSGTTVDGGVDPQDKALEERVRLERTREQLVWLRNSGIFIVVAGALLLMTNTISSRYRGTGVFNALMGGSVKAKISLKDSLETSWSKTGTKPNIIFMLADDLGYNSIQYSDSTDLKYSTPFLTEMANRGIRLSNYYAMEVCTPSRASLLTGRYPLSIGMQFNEVTTTGQWALNASETLLPDALRSGGYSTYGLGKWNLGHFSPRFLPTARGFDYYMGFLTGETYYWSKLLPTQSGVHDLMYSDANCYYGYDGEDMHEYSTFLYRDKAVKVIRNHDFDSKPLFMYLSFQGVHDPYHDHNQYTNGIPKEYLPNSTWSGIHSTVVGRERRQYALSLALMDNAAKKVVKALKQVDQLDNSIIVWTSDNGGCVLTGGRNGDLRGSKGTLFEGGTKVDAFIYSPLLDESVRGSVYSSVMHVSDWMPTILDMAGVSFTPDASRPFDGVSHASNLKLAGTDDVEEVRTTMLYNFYTNIEDMTRDGSAWSMWSNSPLAIRTTQYKLVHAYDDGVYSTWYSADDKDADDDNSLENSATCSQTDTLSGNYTMFLFDLLNDPNETINLYDNDSFTDLKTDLYNELVRYAKDSNEDYTTFYESITALPAFVAANHYVVPWVTGEKLASDSARSFWPEYCRSDSLLSPGSDNDDYADALGWADESDDVLLGDDDDDDDDGSVPTRNDDLIDTSPTLRPTTAPTPKPSHSANYTPDPTAEPTAEPSGPTIAPTPATPQNLPTIRPSATKLTSLPTHPTAEPSSPPTLAKPTFAPSPSTAMPSVGKPTQKPTNTPMPSAAKPTQKPSPTTESENEDLEP